MDGLFKILILTFIIIIILSMFYSIIKRCCCRTVQGNILSNGPAVTVTTTTHPSQPQPTMPIHQGGVPPYPISNPNHPTPQPAPSPGFNTYQPPYPTNTPYPPGPTPYPPAPSGVSPGYPSTTAPGYPPTMNNSFYQSGDHSANPPPYDVAVANPPVQPLPAKEVYSKQSPYNPNY